MYRAQNDNNYADENINTGDLTGVLWYLHNEVVTQCPRLNAITRLRRLRVTMKNEFIPYVAFDRGKCTVPECHRRWINGYLVGCQNGPQYGDTLGKWFSLPGHCPSATINDKTSRCMDEEPGGACKKADLIGDCTYHVEQVGEISIDELERIDNYTAFCADGSMEFDKIMDKGIGSTFWNKFGDAKLCHRRAQQVKAMFRFKYPDVPDSIGEPPCVFRSFPA